MGPDLTFGAIFAVGTFGRTPDRPEPEGATFTSAARPRVFSVSLLCQAVAGTAMWNRTVQAGFDEAAAECACTENLPSRAIRDPAVSIMACPGWDESFSPNHGCVAIMGRTEIPWISFHVFQAANNITGKNVRARRGPLAFSCRRLALALATGSCRLCLFVSRSSPARRTPFSR